MIAHPGGHVPCEHSFGKTGREPHGLRGSLMLRIERFADGDVVRFTISGRVEAAHLPELQRLIDEETAADRPIVLDLKEVKLVHRDTVSFFMRCEAKGVRLDHCPTYLRKWIEHEAEEPWELESPVGECPTTERKK